jgi:hypothetical protein
MFKKDQSVAQTVGQVALLYIGFNIVMSAVGVIAYKLEERKMRGDLK